MHDYNLLEVDQGWDKEYKGMPTYLAQLSSCVDILFEVLQSTTVMLEICAVCMTTTTLYGRSGGGATLWNAGNEGLKVLGGPSRWHLG